MISTDRYGRKQCIIESRRVASMSKRANFKSRSEISIAGGGRSLLFDGLILRITCHVSQVLLSGKRVHAISQFAVADSHHNSLLYVFLEAK